MKMGARMPTAGCLGEFLARQGSVVLSRLIFSTGTRQHPHPDMPVYAASKAAQENLVRNLAKQPGPDGITVNNLAPGVILTDRNTEVLADEAYAGRVRQIIPLRSFGESTDCVGAALLLCVDAGRCITGVDLPVDGGMGIP